MAFPIRLLQLFPLVLLCSCAPTTSLHPPSDWKDVDESVFVFSVPPDMKPLNIKGVFTPISTYSGDSISMDVDASPHSDPLEKAGGASDFASHEERIGGRKARIASFRFPRSAQSFEYAIGIYFPKVADKDVRLTVFSMCKSRKNYGTALKIFRTIRFK